MGPVVKKLLGVSILAGTFLFLPESFAGTSSQHEHAVFSHLDSFFLTLSPVRQTGSSREEEPERAISGLRTDDGMPDAARAECVNILIPSGANRALFAVDENRSEGTASPDAVTLASGRLVTGTGGSPWFGGVRFTNSMRIHATPSGSTFQLSDRGDLAFKVRSIDVGLLLEALGRTAQQGAAGSRSVSLEERYGQYQRSFAQEKVDLQFRLGTKTNLGFGNGLVAGALNLDGFSASGTFFDNFNGSAFVGVSRDLLPELSSGTDLPVEVIPQESREGMSLAGAHIGFDNRKNLTLGLSLLNTKPAGEPSSTAFIGINGTLDTDKLTLEGETAFSPQGGMGAFVRMRLRPQHFTTLGLGVRDYRSFANRVNLPPLYSGVSGGNDTDELGWFLTLDVAPWQTLSAGVDVDTTRRHDGTNRKTDALLRLQFTPTRRVSGLLTFEMEQGGARRPRILTAMTSYRLQNGGRFSGRFSRDFDGVSSITLFHLSGQYPLLERRLTVLAEHTLRQLDNEGTHTSQIGCTLRLWTGNFITVRYGVTPDGPDSLSATVFTRYW